MTETAPSRVAEPKVQLIGCTVFVPPIIDEEGDRVKLYWPDEKNELKVQLGALRQYDGQALAEFAGRACYQAFDKKNPATATNEGYLLNMASQNHGSVVEHGMVSFYLTGISRNLSHELVRHRHLSFSQLSQRYVDSSNVKVVVHPLIKDWMEALFDEGRLQHPDHKILDEEGRELSKEEALAEGRNHFANELIEARLDDYAAFADEFNSAMPGLKTKQIREAARGVLPTTVETRMVVTGNYRSWLEFLSKRDHPAADREIQGLAKEIGLQLALHAPNIFGPEALATWRGESKAQQAPKERPSAQDWEQKISRALGIEPGEFNLKLDEALTLIERMKEDSQA